MCQYGWDVCVCGLLKLNIERERERERDFQTFEWLIKSF